MKRKISFLEVHEMDKQKKTLVELSRAQSIFKSACPEYQQLIRDILNEERGKMHLKKRKDIHSNIYGHIKRVIK